MAPPGFIAEPAHIAGTPSPDKVSHQPHVIRVEVCQEQSGTAEIGVQFLQTAKQELPALRVVVSSVNHQGIAPAPHYIGIQIFQRAPRQFYGNTEYLRSIPKLLHHMYLFLSQRKVSY